MSDELIFNYFWWGVVFGIVIALGLALRSMINRAQSGYFDFEEGKRKIELAEMRIKSNIEMDKMQRAALPEGKGNQYESVEVERD